MSASAALATTRTSARSFRGAVLFAAAIFLVSVISPPSLMDDVDDFWHYGKIARYDMAAAITDGLR